MRDGCAVILPLTNALEPMTQALSRESEERPRRPGSRYIISSLRYLTGAIHARQSQTLPQLLSDCSYKGQRFLVQPKYFLCGLLQSERREILVNQPVPLLTDFQEGSDRPF